MSKNKIAGIALMVAFAGALIVWGLGLVHSPGTIARISVSGFFALCIFAAWWFIVLKESQ